MSDPGKQERIEEFLRKSLLGEEVVNTQFHLFSARSFPSGRVSKPRVLCANNELLAKSSKFFLDLLSADINASDTSLIDLADDGDVPSNARVDAYGYESDSDLDECIDPIPVPNVKSSRNRPTRSRHKNIAKTRSKDDGELFDGSESDGSDIFVMSPEQPGMEGRLSLNKIGLRGGSVSSSETVVQETSRPTSANQTTIRLRSLASRHIFVKDTAFQTWYTLLNYLYTDNFDFLPLGSAMPGGQPHESSTSSLDEPRCSAKSMYRLACKVGLDHLRDEAFSYIRGNLTEHNILKELSSSLVSKHPQLLEMELDVLYSHIGSPPVVANFPALAKRIANNELPHGADIVVGIHARLLQESRPLPLRLATSSWSSVRAEPTLTEAEAPDETGTPSDPRILPPADGEPAPGVPLQASAGVTVPATAPSDALNAGGKGKGKKVNKAGKNRQPSSTAALAVPVPVPNPDPPAASTPSPPPPPSIRPEEWLWDE